MAYVSQEMKKELSVGIKRVLKKYGMKGTIGIDNHRGLKVNLKEGVIDFGKTNYQVNTYHISSRNCIASRNVQGVSIWNNCTSSKSTATGS